MKERKKVQNVKAEKAQHTSRRLTPVPGKLGYLIDLVNCLNLENTPRKWGEDAIAGLEQAMKRYRDTHKEMAKSIDITKNKPYSGPTREEFEKAYTSAIERLVIERLVIEYEKMPINLKHYLSRIEYHPSGDRQLSALERYTALFHIRECFIGIAQFSKKVAGQWDSDMWVENIMLPENTTLIITIDSDGRLTLGLPEYIDELREALNGVDAARIRQCPICEKIFWAGRKDQTCCSKECGNVLYNRRYREKKDDIAYQRYLNSEYKRKKGDKHGKTRKA